MPNVSTIIEMREYLLRKFTRRNELYQELRKFYNSEYFTTSEAQGIRLVYNLIAASVDRYTDFMIQPPDWQVIPTGTEKEALLRAEKQEKFLYAQYEHNNISIIQPWVAHLQSLLGMFAIEARPHFTPDGQPIEKTVQIDIPVPEYVLPLPKTDNVLDLEAVIVLGDVYGMWSEQFQPDIRHDQRIHRANITKYYDKDKIIVLKDGKEIWQVEHNFGFIPIVIGQNRIKPHFVEGTGDMDQAAGLQKYFNDLLSWQADIIEYYANPISIVKGYTGDNLPTGPGAQWHLGKDMDATFLVWPGQAPTVENMLSRVQQGIEDLTFIGDPMMGRNIPSGTSGSAVRSLLSGIQAAFLRKQVTMGTSYVRLNEMIFRITEKYFADKEILLRGKKKNDVFVDKMKGADIGGNYRTQAIFPPGVLDQGTRLDIEIRKMESRLQSRRTTMESIGIQSPTDEEELIRQEQEEELERETLRSGGVAGIDPERAREFRSAASGLANQGSGFGGGAVAPLVEAISRIPKIKGSVFFGGQEGGSFIIVLTDQKDKATIVNRVPQQFKGKLKFRAFVEGQDDDLTPIVDNEEVAA